MTDDHKLGTNRKGLVTRYTHVKYESLKSYQSKGIANVKVFVDKQKHARTNGQTNGPRTLWP